MTIELGLKLQPSNSNIEALSLGHTCIVKDGIYTTDEHQLPCSLTPHHEWPRARVLVRSWAPHEATLKSLAGHEHRAICSTDDHKIIKEVSTTKRMEARSYINIEADLSDGTVAIL